MNTYLVTGGAGFIGSHLCNALILQNHKVINVDNFDSFYDPEIKRKNVKHLINHKNHELQQVDIRDKSALKKIFEQNRIDGVIHLAALAGVRPSIENPVLYEEVNVKGTINLLECLKEYEVHQLIFGSSSSVYGNSDFKLPFKENQILGPMISPYGITKKSAEDYCYLYHYLYQINTIALRFFTVYGPCQRPDLAIYKFTKMILQNQTIPLFGDGNSMRNYTYVSDIVKGIQLAINYLDKKKNVFEVINLSGDKSVSLIQLQVLLEKGLAKKAVINQLPMQPGDVLGTNADINKARELLNYYPETTIEEGIINFINWFKTVHKL
ncbi:UDP-glucuronate 4-epimerase [Pedobacter sp. CG_S7]|uniref:GDP-mannose 4,6-dehydratase n=1 Tax=Pedobacter sp. CG_S7 TaxID=3143930 RepID=UPI00339912C5